MAIDPNHLGTSGYTITDFTGTGTFNADLVSLAEGVNGNGIDDLLLCSTADDSGVARIILQKTRDCQSIGGPRHF